MEFFLEIFTQFQTTISDILQIFNKPIFKIGESEINIGTIIIFFLSFYILIFSSKKIRNLLLFKILAKSNLKKTFRETIANSVRVFILLIGTIII